MIRLISKEPLTKPQQAVLDFILGFMRRQQKPPTMREIGQHFGWTSPNATKRHLQTLVQKGYLTSDGEHRSRSYLPVVSYCPYCGRSPILRSEK